MLTMVVGLVVAVEAVAAAALGRPLLDGVNCSFATAVVAAVNFFVCAVVALSATVNGRQQQHAH